MVWKKFSFFGLSRVKIGRLAVGAHQDFVEIAGISSNNANR
jgi:hypothetical protein